MINLITFSFLLLSIFLAGCENTDFMLATEAGIDAVKAISLSNEDIARLARESSITSDAKHKIAPSDSSYSKRLHRLTADYQRLDGTSFNYNVYLSNNVNAFAMADGTIRIYSKLMDMMDDGELLFVIGHEAGHVVKQHIKKKIKMAYAAKAVRKGIASQGNGVGLIAASQIGGFMELLLGAQFSQFEEREADDYGLKFLQGHESEATAAISALNKLATLGNNHSFLSSHPAPAERALRLERQLNGQALSIDEKKSLITDKIRSFYENNLSFFKGPDH